jgi:hypothetical protein
MSGWNLPPGCNDYDLPGNRPEDEAWEYWLETYGEDLDTEGMTEQEAEDHLNREFQKWQKDQDDL